MSPGRPRIEPKRTGRSWAGICRVLNWASLVGGCRFDVQPGKGLCNAQVGKQQRDRLGGDRGAAVGVDGPAAARLMRCFAYVAAVSFSARAVDSRVATIHPAA